MNMTEKQQTLRKVITQINLKNAGLHRLTKGKVEKPRVSPTTTP